MTASTPVNTAALVAAAVAQAAAQGPDMTKAQKGGGGEYTPPAAGPTRLRLVGYFELGLQADEYQGKPKNRDKVQLVFELSGPKHPAKVNDDGSTTPIRMTITESYSLNDKSNFWKLFQKMNYDGSATHIAQLLGKAFRGTVYHKVKGDKTYANLRNDDGYSITAPYYQDPETGEERVLAVAEPITPLKVFLWNFATKEMWDSIFIDGEYPAKTDEKTGEVILPAKSKNVIQNAIRSALNWSTSPMAAILAAGGEPDLPGAEAPARSEEDQQAGAEADAGASADPLAAY